MAVKLKAVKDTGGFETWPVETIERYRRRHKLGTRARLAMELLYGTMASRGATRLTSQVYVFARAGFLAMPELCGNRM